MCLKGRNCFSHCVHRKCKINVDKDDIEFYCEKHPDVHKEFCKENSSKPYDWVMKNMRMNCYNSSEIIENPNDLKYPSVKTAIHAILLLVFFFLGVLLAQNSPSAMDVYRGKTTLEITYKDGIAIDSIVVFK